MAASRAVVIASLLATSCAMALAYPRGTTGGALFSSSCEQYPGKRVVLVTVSEQYMAMFQNWLHFAKEYLTSTEQLVVVAEDAGAEQRLRELQLGADYPDFQWFTSSNVKKSAASALPQTSAKDDTGDDAVMDLLLRTSAARRHVHQHHASLRGLHEDTPHTIQAAGNHSGPVYESQSFGDVVTQRPTHLMNFLTQGCTVLYVDIDTVWNHDPFLELGALPESSDLVLTDDEPHWVNASSTGTYLCTCFMYVQPTHEATRLMEQWKVAATGLTTNQRPFNAVLRQARDEGWISAQVMPLHKFPPGESAGNFTNATVYHANWVEGLDGKIEFFRARGLWHEGLLSDFWPLQDMLRAFSMPGIVLSQ